MLIRHCGIYVRNIYLVDSILIKLGFIKVYDEIEIWQNEKTNIRKYTTCSDYKIELIESRNILPDSFHICLEMEVPFFMREYAVIKGVPFDKNLLVDFVSINDSVYFEFVRKKNEL